MPVPRLMMFLAGLVLGAAICSLPYVVYAAEFPPLLITTIALALAAAGLAVARPADRWLSSAGVGVGIVVPIIVTIVLDLRRDPTSHNLAPFEILIGLAAGMPPALVGALVGGLMNRGGLRRPLVGDAGADGRQRVRRTGQNPIVEGCAGAVSLRESGAGLQLRPQRPRREL
jgi:hypothetical protein